MVEKVARALAEKHYAHVGGPDAECLVPGTPNWKFCVEDARTAIEAQRDSASAVVADVSRDAGTDLLTVGHVLQAYFTAALSDKQESAD